MDKKTEIQKLQKIDPDPAVVIGLTLSGIAAVSSLYPIIKDIHKTRRDKKLFKQSLDEVYETLKNLRFTLTDFRWAITEFKFLLIKAEHHAHNAENILDKPFEYGVAPFLLSLAERERYHELLRRITGYIRRFHIELKKLEDFMIQYGFPKHVDNNELYVLKDFIERLNHLKRTEVPIGKMINNLIELIEELSKFFEGLLEHFYKYYY